MALAVVLCAAASSVLRAEPPLFMLDSPFEVEGVFQPTRIYTVDPQSGEMTLKADIGATYSACLGLAAASSTLLYAACSDHDPVEVDGDDTCFSCVLVEVVLDPLSTVPTSITKIGRIHQGTATIAPISGMTFRSDGGLYAVNETNDMETLHRIDLGDAGATAIGPVTIGCTSDGLDVQGGDLTFDDLDRLWLWTNHPSPPPTDRGLWEIDPANACGTQSASCAGGHNMAGLAVIGHLSVDTHLRGVTTTASPGDRLYVLVPGNCPSGFVELTLDGSGFSMSRGDLDSPFCETDASCEDGSPCTTDVCTPGGCRHDASGSSGPCDDGDATTCADVCDAGVCQGTPVPEPTEVDASVLISKNGGGAAEISWTATSGTFSVYRGSLDAGTPWSYNQTCLAAGVPGPPATDSENPASQVLFHYLVSRVELCRESVLGRDSAGIPVPNASPCGISP
jgi:hypothetical protein